MTGHDNNTKGNAMSAAETYEQMLDRMIARYENDDREVPCDIEQMAQVAWRRRLAIRQRLAAAGDRMRETASIAREIASEKIDAEPGTLTWDIRWNNSNKYGDHYLITRKLVELRVSASLVEQHGIEWLADRVVSHATAS